MMGVNLNKFVGRLNFGNLNYGTIFINIGIILLFSAPIFAFIFIITSLVISFTNKGANPIKDNLNIFLYLVIFLMISSCLINQLPNQGLDIQKSYFESTNAYYSLFNWIPLFICYWGLKPYLRTKAQRALCRISLISGTIPLLISGLGQYLFKWYGPLELFNGMIIWYQRGISSGGLTSVFNNQNYAGCIFSTMLPLFIVSFSKKNSKLENFLILILIFLVISSIIFTHSRNSFLSMILVLILLVPKNIKWIAAVLLSFFITLLSLFPLNLNLIKFFREFNLGTILDDPRIVIWENSFKYILEKPFLGWGGHGFSSIWNNNIRFIPLNLENVRYYGHAHNLPLEITIKYGILTSIILTGFLVYVIFRSFRIIYLKRFNTLGKLDSEFKDEKGWFIATLVMLFANFLDIQYYDIRVSFLLWLLLAGLRNITNNYTKPDKVT